MAILWVLFGIACLYLLVQLITLLSNLWSFPVLQPFVPSEGHISPVAVSILLPARNEAHTLPHTLARLLQQPEAQEILVLDDNSEDATAAVVRSFADPRLRLIQGKPLPDGWGGKNWACHQLAQQAQGELLLFCDADVYWQPGALACLLYFKQKQGAAFVSVWPRQCTPSLFLRLSVPLIDMILLGLLPYLGVRYLPFAAFAAGNGQVMLWDSWCYQQMGGHAAFATEVLEDVRMAQATKATGARIALALGGDQLAVQMYDSPAAVVEGFSKNILAAHSQQRWLLLADASLQLLAYSVPLLLAWWLPWWWLLLALGMLQRALTCYKTHRSPWEALLQPFAPLVFWRIAWRALRRRGYVWKGRHYS